MELQVHIEKRFPGFHLQVNFTAGRDPLGLLGGSGAGKSMILRCIAGLVTPDRGRISLNGRILFDSDQGINLPSRERKIGYLFQDYAVFPHMTVAENILFGLRLLGLSQEEQIQRVARRIDQFQLHDLENRFPHQLSGGQLQRVAFARALSTEPEVLLLDEPFSALDHHLRTQMETMLIDTLRQYSGVTLFVTHNLEEAYRVCDHLLVLSRGKQIALDEKKRIFSRPPTVTVAQLTGCKNTSSVRIAGTHQVEALDWGCLLTLDHPVSPNWKHAGIRANHLRLVTEPAKDHRQNTFPCRIVQTIESPHRVTIRVTVKGPTASASSSTLQVELSKKEWEFLQKEVQPLQLEIDTKDLFFMDEER
ncbi:sulfate/molybdate ABC transporter ATP-binding protein [Heliobacterium mobile]|uniref:sulfate/molybdate ABC transporter ATP-binding protein n=1 Tax=Heliobacterium mobile TaxID=28064 RepID=UPI0014783DA5|nr:ATP-binding cassette domain-containing protein [Heliobacterium mobile]